MNLKKILIITLFFHIIINATRPVITLAANSYDASLFEIGMITALYALLPLFLSIYCGQLIDKFGDKIPSIFAYVLIIIGLIIPIFMSTITGLVLSQLLLGFANVFIPISMQNLLGHESTEKNRDNFFSLFTLIIALGAVIGPIAGGYLTEYFSFEMVYIFCILCSLLGIIGVLSLKIKNQIHVKEKHSILSSLQLLKNPQIKVALFASALVLYSKDIFIAYFPLLGHHLGLSEVKIGWIIAIQGFAIMFIRFLLPKLLDWFSRKYILFISITVAGVSFICIPLFENIYLLALCTFLMGCGLGCGQPISMTITYNASPIDRTAEVLGLRLTVNRLAQVIAPLAFGSLGGILGIVSVFYLSSIFLITGSWIFRPSFSSLRMPNLKEKHPFK